MQEIDHIVDTAKSNNNSDLATLHVTCANAVARFVVQEAILVSVHMFHNTAQLLVLMKVATGGQRMGVLLVVHTGTNTTVVVVVIVSLPYISAPPAAHDRDVSTLMTCCQVQRCL